MTTRVGHVWLEHRRDSPFVAVPRPRVSWTVIGAPEGWVQSRAEVRNGEGHIVTVDGAAHLYAAWPFADIPPEQEQRIGVRVQDANGAWTPWSDDVRIRRGAPETWEASFVALPAPDRIAQPFLARRRIPLDGAVGTATLYLSALGAVRASIDGELVDDAALAPGWTSYQERVLMDAVDVTARLSGDSIVIVLEAAGAWYTEEYGFDGGERRVYGEQPAVAAQLVITYADGSRETIATDGTWHTRGDGEIVDSGLYAGELVDARRRRNWAREEIGWTPAAVVAAMPRVEPRTHEPVRVVDRRIAADIRRTERGTFLLDFGQNFAGRLRLTVSGPAGTEVSVRHAEVLEGGELALRPLRRAAAHDRFILAGDGPETFEPFGTFHGFRYAEISGWPGELEADAVEALVLSSDMRRVGWLETSDPLLNRLHENVVWSMRSNFLSVPTDCPQRDERLGWTGDIAVFAPTAVTLFDATGFLSSWLDDLAIEQRRHDGVVPFVVPDVMGFPPGPAAGWGDAAVLVPSATAAYSGDSDVLRRHYESMRTWVRVVSALAGGGDLWEGSIQFGDWLDPTAPPDQAGAARADRDLVANAYRYRSLRLLAETAVALGHEDAGRDFTAEAERVRAAFVRAYVTPGGRMTSDAPTAYVLALRLDLIGDATLRANVAEQLVECVRRDGYHIGTGFLGTPHLLDALVDAGRTDVAEALLMQTENPSWLYPVVQGATTVWERWDSLLEDGAVNPGEMTSFNHYAFGAVVDWMYRRLAGVAPAGPGYSVIRFAPTPFHRLDHAQARVETVSGDIVGGWRRSGGDIAYHLTVPAHSRAVVVLPGQGESEVGPGSYEWTHPSLTAPARPPKGTPSLVSPLRDIVDDEQAYRTVVAALSGYGEAGRLFRSRTDWSARSPLIAMLWSLPPDAAGRIAGALAVES
jgi:alpha-L-rhamnosidase